MRLRTTFAITLLLLGAVLSGIVYAGFTEHKADITSQERTALETGAETAATDIGARLGEKQQTVDLWAANDAIADHGSERQRAAIATFRRKTDFDGVSVVDRNGTMVAIDAADLDRENESRLVGMDVSDRPYVRASLDGDRYISSPFAAASGNYIVTITAPIRNDGRVVGVLVGAFHLTATDFFEQSASNLHPEQSMLVRSASNATLHGESPTANSLAQTATVERTGWEVTVWVSRTSVAGSLRRATYQQAGAVGAVLFVVAGLGLWVSRLTLRQIDTLVSGFDALEAGDYETRLDLGSADEWQRISRRFTSLAQTLDQRESQLSVFNRVFRHNLRNDMSVVLLSAERILADDDLPDDLRGAARRIERRADSFMATSERAREIHERLLLSGGDPGTLDLAASVESVGADLRAEFPRATVVTDTPSPLVVPGVDVVPLLLTELGRNALAHNDRPPADRRVEFAVTRRDDHAAVAVSDNGDGLPAIERDLLVGDRVETPTAHGSGLGMWLVKWFVESLSGDIEVSCRDGGETTVTVLLPLAT